MKKQIKPFKIEVKGRARKRGAPAGLWGDLLTQNDEVAVLQPEVASTRTDAAAPQPVSQTASKRDRGPRILDAVAPTPTQVSKGKEGEDIDEVDLDEVDEVEVPEEEAAMDSEIVSAMDGSSSIEPEPLVVKPPRLSRRSGEFRAGERWKRHLPRWKR